MTPEEFIQRGKAAQEAADKIIARVDPGNAIRKCDIDPAKHIVLDRTVLVRMEREIETYRQIAIEEFHYQRSQNTWEQSTEAVDREFFERMRRQGFAL